MTKKNYTIPTPSLDVSQFYEDMGINDNNIKPAELVGRPLIIKTAIRMDETLQKSGKAFIVYGTLVEEDVAFSSIFGGQVVVPIIEFWLENYPNVPFTCILMRVEKGRHGGYYRLAPLQE